MATYSVVATLCPTLATAGSLLVPGTSAAPSAKSLAAGDTSALLSKFNENATRLDVTGRRGGGGYAVTEGLDLSASGLVCTVTAGQAMLDGPATLAASGTVTLADNAYNWVYLLQDGTLTKTSDASTTPPAAPASVCAFLGRIQVTAGTPGTADYSGRLTLLGGTLYRRTGDSEAPGDTPPATLQFLAVTANGAYWWDGTTYRRVSETLTTEPLTVGASETLAIAATRQVVLSKLTVSGTLAVLGIARFV